MTPEQHDEVRVGQLGIRYLVDGTASGAGLGIFELTVPPGARVPPAHSHAHNEEIAYVLAGTLRYSVGDETRDLKPGECMHTPRGSVHAFANPHGEVARALIVMTPDVGMQYFRDVAAIVTAPGGPAPGALAAVMARYGLVLAGAPPSAR